MSFLWDLLSPFIGEAIVGALAILAVLIAWVRGQSKGKREERNQQLAKAYEDERSRTNVEDRYRSAADSDRERMRNVWRNPRKY